MMRAMILAAGLGTRLRPLTEVCPKPLLPLMLQPMLGHLLDQLRRQGVHEVAINLHHRAPQLSGWLGDGQRWGVNLHLSYEPELLGTAGGIKQVESFLSQAPFWVINADVLTDVDLHAVWQWHCERQALVTMVVQPHPQARRYGPVRVDAAGRVLQINGRPDTNTSLSGQETVFTGMQIVSPGVLDRIPRGRFCSTTAEIYPAVIAENRAVYGYRHSGYWMDIGVAERYLQAHWDILDGTLGDRWIEELPPGSQAILGGTTAGQETSSVTILPPVVLGTGVEVAPGACLGPYVVLGAGCRVETGAVIQRSVIWENVRIAAGATVQRSILAAGVRVSKGSVLHDVTRTF